MCSITLLSTCQTNKLRMKKKAYTSPQAISIVPIFNTMLCGSIEIGTTDENVDNSDKSNNKQWNSSMWNELNNEQTEE